MALTDRIVLFHDRSPQGFGHPEIYGRGLSVLHNVVPLPHARARLLLDDARHGWPSSPGDSRLPAVSSWRMAPR
jgi:hypothetical protein